MPLEVSYELVSYIEKSYNNYLGPGAPRSFLITSFLHRCLIITSLAQVSPEVPYELVSYIDVL